MGMLLIGFLAFFGIFFITLMSLSLVSMALAGRIVGEIGVLALMVAGYGAYCIAVWWEDVDRPC